jgi:mutator protein MutT
MPFSLLRVAVIVVNDKNEILLIRRFKDGREFWVIPGGSVEEGENSEQAATREIKEETNLDVVLGEKFLEYENAYWGDGVRHETYFLAESFSGDEVKIIGEEKERNSRQNRYELEWVPFKKINDLNLVPIIVKNKIIEKFASIH